MININKYQNGKIYKIVSPSNPDLVYYGSTHQLLCNRMAAHRQNYKKNKPSSAKEILKFEDAIILLIENYPCNNREELNKKEGEYILNNNCINKQIAGRSQKEVNQLWRNNNKEKSKEYAKQYKEVNKEKIKEYRDTKKEEKKLYDKQYREKKNLLNNNEVKNS